jgi:hypothetical protein
LLKQFNTVNTNKKQEAYVLKAMRLKEALILDGEEPSKIKASFQRIALNNYKFLYK